MMTKEHLEAKLTQLKNSLISVTEGFVRQNPDLPAIAISSVFISIAIDMAVLSIGRADAKRILHAAIDNFIPDVTN